MAKKIKKPKSEPPVTLLISYQEKMKKKVAKAKSATGRKRAAKKA